MELVYISAMPPGAIFHARFIRRRLRGRFAKAQVIVGVWGFQGELSQAAVRIGIAPAATVASLAAALQPILSRLGTEPDTETKLDGGPQRVLEMA